MPPFESRINKEYYPYQPKRREYHTEEVLIVLTLFTAAFLYLAFATPVPEPATK